MLINRIAELRGQLITREELAKELNVSINTINEIETGRYAPEIDLAYQIKQALEKLVLEKNGLTLRLTMEQLIFWVPEEDETELAQKYPRIQVEFPS